MAEPKTPDAEGKPCPTVKIKSDHPEHGGFVEINESDFRKVHVAGIAPDKHERFIEPPPGEVPASPLPPPPTK